MISLNHQHTLTTHSSTYTHRWHLYDLLANRNAWWAPGKTLELRRRLKPYWQASV